jgi:WD40 repeat protein
MHGRSVRFPEPRSTIALWRTQDFDRELDARTNSFRWPRGSTRRGPIRELFHVDAVAFSPDNTVVAATGVLDDDMLTGWRDEYVSQGASHKPDPNRLLGVTCVWDATTGEKRVELREAPATSGHMYSMGFSADGATLIVLGETVRYWDWQSGTLLRTLHAGEGKLAHGDGWLSAEHEVAVVTLRTGAIGLWQLGEDRIQELTPRIPQDRSVYRIRGSRDLRTLAVSDRDGYLHLWRVKD